MEFGMPQRSATKDANAGVVNPPAKKSVARNTVGTSNKTQSSSDKAMMQLGDAVGSQLGGALSSMIAEKTANNNEQMAIDAARRQGGELAINQMDLVSKRTGWEKAVFGQTASYRGAQQRAVQNGVQANYLQELNDVDSRAGESPKEFADRRREINDTLLKQYKDDPDTRLKVQQALVKTEGKLTSAHLKAHYGYTQLQEQETTRQAVRATLDGYNLQKDSMITPEEKAAHLKEVKDYFESGGEEYGIDPVAWQEVFMGEVKSSMKAGNSGPMKAIQALGMDKDFSAAQQQQWDASLDAYDTQFKQKADLIRMTGDAAIDDALNEHEVDAAVAQKEKNLNELVKRSSGTQRSALIIAGANLDISKDNKAVREYMKSREDALKKAEGVAKSDSDKRIITEMKIAKENMDQVLSTATNPAESQAALDAYNTKLAELFPQLTPTVANELKFEKQSSMHAMAQGKLQKEIQKTRADAAEKKLELADIAARNQAGADYFNEPTLAGKVAIDHDNAFKPKEKEDYFETHLLQKSQAFIGGDNIPTAKEFAKQLQTDEKLQSMILKQVTDNPKVKSPMLEGILSGALGSVDRLFDEDGNTTELGKKTVAMVDRFANTDKGQTLLGGKEKRRQWALVSNLVNAGAGQGNVERSLQSYKDNVGKRDTSGFRWKEHIGDMSKVDWMEAKFEDLGIYNPSRPMITDALEDYQLYLVSNGYDTKEANNDLYRQLTNNKTMVHGNMIPNGASLNEITDYSAEDLIDLADKHNFFMQDYQKLQGRDAPTANSWKDIENLKIYTRPGYDGMFMSSPSTSVEVHISADKMKKVQRDAERLAESRKVEEKSKSRKYIQRMATERGFRYMSTPPTN